MKYYVKKTGANFHLDDFDEVTFDELVKGFKNGSIQPDWGGKASRCGR